MLSIFGPLAAISRTELVGFACYAHALPATLSMTSALGKALAALEERAPSVLGDFDKECTKCIYQVVKTITCQQHLTKLFGALNEDQIETLHARWDARGG